MSTLTTFSLEVIGPYPVTDRNREDDKRVLSNLPALIEAAEEDLSDLLPDGYEVKITEAMT